MRTTLNRFCIMLVVTGAAFAATPVATLTTSEPFTLDGHTVTVSGVNSWPIVIGDRVSTGGIAAILVLQNGQRLTVSTHSTIQIAGSLSQPKVVVTSGSISNLGGVSGVSKPAGVIPNSSGGGGCPSSGPGSAPISCYK